MPMPVESANVEAVFQVVRLGTSAELVTALRSHRLRSRLMFDRPVRESSTWMPMTSELGDPMMVTVRLLSYFVVRVPSYSDSRCWNVVYPEFSAGVVFRVTLPAAY